MNFDTLILTNSPIALLNRPAPTDFVLNTTFQLPFNPQFGFQPDPQNYPIFAHDSAARAAVQNPNFLTLEPVKILIQNRLFTPFSKNIENGPYSKTDKRRLLKYFQRHVSAAISAFDLDDFELQKCLEFGLENVENFVKGYEELQENFYVVFQFNKSEFYEFLGRKMYRAGGVYMCQNEYSLVGKQLTFHNTVAEFKSVRREMIIPKYAFYYYYIVNDIFEETENAVEFFADHIRLLRRGAGKHLKVGFASVEIWSKSDIAEELRNQYEDALLSGKWEYEELTGSDWADCEVFREEDLIYLDLWEDI
uniref:Uncharacterized protein n=1 Tax=Spironucleus salmonicida TaxID=348837 RepID=V6LGX4_9EUKA|eukprot:EST43795.1 Hypothetical protein SS50377_16413 [Spironucleus salmonicida]